MAVRMMLIDDLDGTEDAKTIEFGLEGRRFEVDLTEKNVAKLRAALEPFLQVARHKGSTGGTKPAKKASSRGAHLSEADRTLQLEAIRQWGRGRGFKVSDRGRVRREVVLAFNQAHASDPKVPAFSG